ncbi:tRNA (adenosine(37)-N6)-dimethylallyltransferase MiaA [Dyadobacter sediminis]|uniref:tRNA dimethylallyltransferase n=1 Tax=Dyadobacter sediminis TaxID=1493691 RepID=A0A5R9KLL3_9BACT|nr:tRNA (adenosine(37)-N6)-dimethylallyltransferase MiaA [Dyadobacter sediminis]TLU96946.1 tRNA (adenosine(37)-N6)-dimethylallyltransferase MiaA [Dyadobacter sediminis]GGB81515.1 tRNA dimethylallyltransferase 2 [Dyadobacter sediminis]
MVPLLVIIGPTASGKTRLATRLANEINGEIISADSRQVYRKMDIGTGKDLAEYRIGEKHIPYHLIDICDAGEQYNVNDFQHDFERIYHEIIANGHVPVLCGGTGFYIFSLLKGHAYALVPVNEALRKELETLSTEALLSRFEQLDSAYRNLADTSTRKRLIRAIEISEFLIRNSNADLFEEKAQNKYHPLVYGLNPAVETRRERISTRLENRLQNGLVEEVQSLLSDGLSAEQLIYYGLEYKYITLFLTGTLTYNEMKQRLETEIHRFAKRQMTFFRKMEKDGIPVHWLPEDYSESEKIQTVIEGYNTYKGRLS